MSNKKVKFVDLLESSSKAPLKGAFFADKLGITRANFNNKLHRKRKYEKFNEEQEKKIIDITKDLIKQLQDFVKNPDFEPVTKNIITFEDIIRGLQGTLERGDDKTFKQWINFAYDENKFNFDEIDEDLIDQFNRLKKQGNKQFNLNY